MRGRYEWENYALGFATFSFFGDFGSALVQDVPWSVLIKNDPMLSPGAFDRGLNPKQMGKDQRPGNEDGSSRGSLFHSPTPLHTHENTTQDPE